MPKTKSKPKSKQSPIVLPVHPRAAKQVKDASEVKQPESIELVDQLPQPQPGAQTTFYNTNADITIFGGAAGAGKSRGLLIKAAQHVGTSGYGAVIFRETSPEITNEGGLWDESKSVYKDIQGAEPREGRLDWHFPAGSAISFRHADKLEKKFLGAQAAFIGIDEVTNWKESDFWFLVSRNRTTCGVSPQICATCNPDCDSFVARLISWWIDPATGYPIEERSGVVRYFYRINETMVWADTPEQLIEQHPELAAIAPPKSFTFIKATIYDNPELLKSNPQYLSNLLALHPVMSERLLKGNWKIRMDKGKSLFNQEAIYKYAVGRWQDKPTLHRTYMAAIDPAYGGQNFFECLIFDITELPFALVAEYRKNYTKPLQCRREAQELLARFKVSFLAVEADNGGVVIAEQIAAELPGTQVEITRSSNISKIVNTDRIAIEHEQGNVVYPPDWHGIAEMENFSASERKAIVENDELNDDTITAWAAGFAHLELALSLRPARVEFRSTGRRAGHTIKY